MPWNEPPGDDKSNGKNPWGKRPDAGPPDLDELLKKFFNNLKNPMGGSNKNSINKNGGTFFSFGAILVVLAVAYVVLGIYIVKPAEQAVITQFGKYAKTTGPGPHWLPPVIQKKVIVNTEQVKTIEHSALMLTKDENIVSVEIAVQYRVLDPENYLFNVILPEKSLKEVVESSLRTVIGHSPMDDILTKGRAAIAANIKSEIDGILEYYQSGIVVTTVAMQPARAPEEVKAAFDDVIKAQEDEVRFINEAETYAMTIEPVARGKAKRILQEAEAYKKQQILLAKGNTERFNSILPEYQRQPQVMRDRLYLGSVAEILGDLKKVMVSTGSGNLLYLPLDKLISGDYSSGPKNYIDKAISEIQEARPKLQDTSTSRYNAKDFLSARNRNERGSR